MLTDLSGRNSGKNGAVVYSNLSTFGLFLVRIRTYYFTKIMTIGINTMQCSHDK